MKASKILVRTIVAETRYHNRLRVVDDEALSCMT